MATIPGPHFTAVPLFMQSLVGEDPINYSAADFGSQLLQAIWPSSGVITPTAFHVEQADTVGWAIKVRTGRAIVGRYLVTSDTTYTIDVSALNTSPVGTRTHRVFLVVQDKLEGGDGYYAHVKVVEDFGSSAAVPEAAAVLLLAAFTISPGQTGITDANISAKPRNASDAGEPLDIKASGALNNQVNANHADGSGANVAGIGPARARYGNGRVQLSGGIWRAVTPAASFVVGATTIGTLPYYLRPLYDVWLTLASSHFKPWRLHIEPDGTMTAHIPDDSAPLYLYFDGASYEID